MEGAHDTSSQRGPSARRGAYPPFQLYVGLHDEALETALARYCVTTTGPVVVELFNAAGPTAADAAVLGRMGQRLAEFGRVLVVEEQPPVQHTSLGRAASPRQHDDRQPIRRSDVAASARSAPATSAGAGAR